LLIKDSYGRWSWPKGKVEPGEKTAETALREIAEEVGLKKTKILCRLGRNNYYFRLKGVLIYKTVYYFRYFTCAFGNNTSAILYDYNDVSEDKW